MGCHDERSLVKKYLSTYSDHTLIDINDLKFRTYSHVLVIPAYREGASFVDTLEKFAKKISESPLIIVVINQPSHEQEDDNAENQRLISMLCATGNTKSSSRNTRLIAIQNLSLLVTKSLIIDGKQGVGFARKIGCDLALFFIDAGIVRCPIIYTTDADAVLPRDYFLRAQEAIHADAAGFVYPFTHLRPKDVRTEQAIVLYEKRLRFYVAGLKKAGSPYAFHTIGSTIAVDSKSYAKVRGFPKISAGEDFYLLNKLKKVGEIISLSKTPIELSARLSSRVAFGTGPALSNILQHDDTNLAKIFYHPTVFDYLEQFLRRQNDAIIEAKIEQAFLRTEENDLIEQAAFSLRGYEQLGHHLCSRRTTEDRLKAFHDWFDGFRTLKFIHFIRNAGFFMCNAHEVMMRYQPIGKSDLLSFRKLRSRGWL